MTTRKKWILTVVVPLQVASAVLAWRDLAHRPRTAVRGPKWLWRVVVSLNPGNSVAYWVFGRRRMPA